MPATDDLQRLADEDLLLLVRDGDADAFEVVYERHGGAAYSLAYRIMGNRSAAEDAVQEALLSVWRSGARYDRARGTVRNWLLGIVHNRSIDALRRNAPHDRRRASADGIEEREEAPDRTELEVARREEAHELREVLHTLPAHQREAIRLAYFGGFTHTQIAEMLGTPIGTVKGRIRLGLDKMRSVMAGEVAA